MMKNVQDRYVDIGTGRDDENNNVKKKAQLTSLSKIYGFIF